jgi:hypothetical protein
MVSLKFRELDPDRKLASEPASLEGRCLTTRTRKVPHHPTFFATPFCPPARARISTTRP